jgi:hypothetical protein
MLDSNVQLLTNHDLVSVVVSENQDRIFKFKKKEIQFTCSVIKPPRSKKFHSTSLITPSNFNISAQRRKLNTSLSFSNKPLK